MYLLVQAQDICLITLGILDEGEVRFVKEIASSPEGYLSVLDLFLSEKSFQLKDFEGVIVVTGPGSFTSSRVSTTIANSIAFTQSIPVIGIENQERLDLGALLKEKSLHREDSVIPSYDRPPLIIMGKLKKGIKSMVEAEGK